MREVRDSSKSSSSDILDVYWDEIKNNQPLKRQEEIELFSKIRMFFKKENTNLKS